MLKRLAISAGILFTLGVLMTAAGGRGNDPIARPPSRQKAGEPAPAGPQTQTPQIQPPDSPPSEGEIRERSKELVANQHKNDAALDEYQRMERYVDRTAGSDPQLILDKTYRMVPTGGETMKILVKDRGMPVDPAQYARQLKTLRDILESMSNPDDPKAKAAYDKYAKRRQERDVFVDVAQNAFFVKWIGREMRDGHSCDVFQLDPNPMFHPKTLFQDALAHVSGKIWVDRETTELVRGEAQALSDIYFGGGILGKLTRGSSISIDQEPIAPGIWEATHFEYNYSGRKFLFPFEQHQQIEAGHYKWIGPPREALAEVEAELSGGKPLPGDP